MTERSEWPVRHRHAIAEYRNEVRGAPEPVSHYRPVEKRSAQGLKALPHRFFLPELPADLAVVVSRTR